MRIVSILHEAINQLIDYFALYAKIACAGAGCGEPAEVSQYTQWMVAPAPIRPAYKKNAG
jgi:hypothetical protein